MSILDEWINPRYLLDDFVESVREDVLAKPGAKYVVLDDFFQVHKIEELIEAHSTKNWTDALPTPDNGCPTTARSCTPSRDSTSGRTCSSMKNGTDIWRI